MPSLSIVMLGGRHARANTEVHDVVLAIGESLEDTLPRVRNAWVAEQPGLHTEAWARINGLEFEGKSDALQVAEAQPEQSDEDVWLINVGGYDPREFGELHRYVLVVAENAVV